MWLYPNIYNSKSVYRIFKGNLNAIKFDYQQNSRYTCYDFDNRQSLWPV